MLKKRAIAMILAAVLALSLLLTACGTGGDTPTGDDATPGVSDTSPTQPGTQTPDSTPGGDTTNPPDDTTEPSDTPDDTEPTTPGLDPTLNILRHTEPLVYNEYWKSEYEKEWGAEIDGILDTIYEQYSKYLNVNISRDAVKVALITPIVISETGYDWDYKPHTNALKEVNDILRANGEEPLNIDNPEQRIAALWIAASLYFGSDDENIDAMNNEYPGATSCCFDIAMAITRARCDSSGPVHSLGIPLYIMQSAGHLDGMYADLFGLERH